ncbi:MAG TPA: two-component regulator propeller domain-containing protein [Bacteroidota bacterium]|nr:two-component regulator propeller domain-containing protein [Bacteroidota bacterium]
MKKKTLLFLAALLFFFELLHAQRDNIRFENISSDQGLSQNSVITICQDRKGFLWFGTYDGLNRFDGYRFKVFKTSSDDSLSLNKNLIWDICEDHTGILWVATDGGLDRYNSEKENFTRFNTDSRDPLSISNNRIRSLCENSDGVLWIGTENGVNIFHRENNSFTALKNDPKNSSSISSNLVRVVFEDSHHDMWVGTENGLNLFDRETKTFHRYMHNASDPTSISDNTIFSLGEDANGYLWVGTQSGGLNRFDRKTGTFKHYFYNPNEPSSLRFNYVRAIYKDKSGELWIGTYGGGMEKYDARKDRFVHYQHDPSVPQSISSNVIYCIKEDQSGIMWIGTDFGGINKYDKEKNQFTYYSNIPNNPKSLPDNSVNCFYEDPDDHGKTMWLGTWKGLVLFNRETQEFTSYVNHANDSHSLSYNVVRTINKDASGNLWIGTDYGLNRFDRRKNKFYRYSNNPQDSHSISNNLIRNIFVDRKNNLWIGSNSSLIDRYDREHDSFIHYANNIPGVETEYNNVWKLIEDHQGNIYVGSDEGGVCKLDVRQQKFVPFAEKNNVGKFSLSVNKVLTLCEDRNKQLWVGTAGGGLNCLNLVTGECSIIDEKNGLASNTIHGIVEDSAGILWVSTNRGLSKVNGKQKKIVNFYVEDGLQSNEFHVNSFSYSKTGEIFFGGIKGFNVFNPEKIQEDTFIPPVVITDIQLFNQSIPIDKPADGRILIKKSITELQEIDLNYTDEVFTVDFSSLDYSAPEKNKYSYFLEGYDKIWNNVGNRHYATYTKIPAGRYRLLIKGSSHRDSWNNIGRSLLITITPPFWETLWFKASVVLLIFGIIIFWHQTRTRRIVTHNRELVQHIQERRLVEEALRNSEEILQRLVASLPDIIIRTDLEGNIIFINETALPMFQTPVDQQILGSNVLTFIAEKDRTRVKENIQKMFDRYLGPQEYSLLLSKDSSIECEVNGDVLRQLDGTPFGMVFIIRDLTEKKKMQAQLLQSQKMEAIGRLAGGVAHDYNNMLGIILGYAVMLEKDIADNPLVLRRVQSIISAAERSANLTKQLLAFARQQIVAPVVVNINQELTSLKKMIGRLVGEDVSLTIIEEPGLGNIKIDPTQFTQIITNLATNARDAIENIGSITIETRNEFIDESLASKYLEARVGNYVLLNFSDSGCGMDKATMAQIFEPFFTTKPKDKGTGLGLATVFGIVKQNNGFIHVESQVGIGTTFSIYFPIEAGSPTEEKQMHENVSLDGSETILLVEDEKELLELIKSTLEHHGYSVLALLSPENACLMAETTSAPIDLLITDVVLPGMNGKELKEQLEKRMPHLKTLFISGYTSDIVAKRGVLDEDTQFLHKPFTPVQLLQKIRSIIST